MTKEYVHFALKLIYPKKFIISSFFILDSNVRIGIGNRNSGWNRKINHEGWVKLTKNKKEESSKIYWENGDISEDNVDKTTIGKWK